MDLKLWLKERELNARQIASRKTIADRSVWIEDANYFNAAYDAIQRAELQGQKPIDMVLHCPACGMQHVDAPDERTPGWVNEPHRSHLCHDCGHIWRPADVPTNGVAAVKTKGKADSPVAQAPNAQQAEPYGNPMSERAAKLAADPVRGPRIEAMREKLAQQAEAQEPVAVIGDDYQLLWIRRDWSEGLRVGGLLFTRPQPAQLQALSEEEVRKAVAIEGLGFAASDIRISKAIQSALAAKNGAVLAVIKAKE